MQTTVKGVVVESYNAEILSESRRLVASIEQILNVKLKYLGTKVKRLTRVVVFCIDDKAFNNDAMSGLTQLCSLLDEKWEAEKLHQKSGDPLSQGSSLLLPCCASQSFRACSICSLNFLMKYRSSYRFGKTS